MVSFRSMKECWKGGGVKEKKTVERGGGIKDHLIYSYKFKI